MGMGALENTAAVAVAPAEAVAAGGGGRFAVLQCGADSDYVRKAYGGYFRVFRALLEEGEGERWQVYRAAAGELPGEVEAEGFAGFVITGSCSDAHGDEPWVLRLLDLLRRLHARRKRLLGVCFGHQANILCRALGGKTGRSSKGWDIGATCIHPTPAAARLFASLNMPPHLAVIEFHRDEVWELPPGAEALAWSNKTSIEMFRYGDHVLGIQGHPEYTKDILMSIVDRLLQHKLIQDNHAEAAKESLNLRQPNREAWKRLCRDFLKGRLLQQQLLL